MEIDTIVALASAQGPAGVAVVRVSGSRAGVLSIVNKLALTLEPRLAKYSAIYDCNAKVIDKGIFLYFPGPKSFTGEDVLEFHGHGNRWVIDSVIKRFCEMGARLAEPGEFSKRAFVNGKIDLVQAEAIADLVSANSKTAARMALASLSGRFSNSINSLLEMLIGVRVQLEAALDFPDEDFEPAAQAAIVKSLDSIRQKLTQILHDAERGAVVQSGIKVVLIGPPNVGKSSLFNHLLGQEEAIVTNIAGTTRDVLSQECRLGGATITLQDTAGVHTSSNAVEVEGIRRAKSRLDDADLVLLMLDDRFVDLGHDGFIVKHNIPVSKKKIIRIWNKSDLFSSSSLIGVFISVKENKGFEAFNALLESEVEAFSGSDGHAFSARFRHVVALKGALEYLARAYDAMESGNWELAAEDCRHVQQELGTITGEFSNEDLLGQIFSTFCIGK